MPFFEAKINQAVILRPGKQLTFVRAFATKPAKELLAKSGKIFGLVEIESAHAKTDDLIDLIIDEIKNNYYFRPDIRFKNEAFNAGELFESALKKTNLAIASFLEKEQILLDLEKINCLIALVCNAEIYFALAGNISAIMFHNLAVGSHRIINVLETTKSPLTAPDPLKFFSQIISGKIRPGDVLFFSTANIFDYFSQEKVKTIITSQAPAEGLNELKESLEKIKSRENFGALVLEVKRAQEIIPKTFTLEEFNYREAATKDSMRELIKTEEETTKLLTPSIIPEIRKIGGTFSAVLQNSLGTVKNKISGFFKKRKSFIRPRIHFPAPVKKMAPPAIFSKKVSNPLKPVFRKFSEIGKTYANKPWRHKLDSILQKLFGGLFAKFKKLPKSSRILLLTTIVLAILFVQSLAWLAVKNYAEKSNEEFNQIIYEAENKKNNAESSLIYRDENLARQFLVEAKNLIAVLKPSSSAQQARLNDLAKGIEGQLQKLRHAILISEPIQLANFANLDSQASLADFAVLNKNVIYTQNHSSHSLYSANLETRVISAVYAAADPGELILGTALSDKELIFFNAAKEIFSFNPADNTLQKISLALPANAKVAELASFRNWLYLLDTAGNQIYRYVKNNGFGQANNWIKEGGINLSEAKSFAIDGSVYVLKATGEVMKLENGKTADFKLKTVEPAFNQPTKIKTTDFSKYLYILDPKNKRLVVVTKAEGNLTAQYYSDTFASLKDFFVDEAAKKIYILNGTSIYGVPASHLK